MPTFYVKIILFFFMWIVKDSTEIRNVKLILPTIIQAGTSATFLCLYDLEGASLYSVQWYRGQYEFFRFLPNENPPTKAFKIPGLYVDTFASNDHQVTLRNIPLYISGEFSCEVTTDAPRFSTSCVSQNLTVTDFSLSLNIPKRQYRFGEIIDSNCTLIPRIPSVKLLFHWNTEPISEEYTHDRFVDTVFLHLNTSIFDTGQAFAVLVQLRCSAILDKIYHIKSKSVSLKLIPSNPASKSKVAKSGICFPLSFLLLLQNVMHLIN